MHLESSHNFDHYRILQILEIIEGAPRSLTELLVRMSLEKYEVYGRLELL